MGKIAVVTGASSGIGKAVTEMLISDGLSVLASGRSIDSTFAESNMLRMISADLLEKSTSERLLATALSNFGAVDYLFVNAGTIESGTIEDIDIDKVCTMVRLKVEASFRLIYTFLKHFRKTGSGHIFITSSVLGTKTRENSGAYAACNHALEVLAESLRMELAATDIQITCIEPGLVATNLHKDWPIHPKELLNIPNPLTPEDIAIAVKEIMQKPDHIRIPKYMILPKGHRI